MADIQNDIQGENGPSVADTMAETNSLAGDIDIKVVKKEFGGKEFDVVYSRAPQLEMMGFAAMQGPRTGQVDVIDGVIIEYDVPVTVRDGSTLYVDVYRPEGVDKVPAILAPFYTKVVVGALMQGVVPGTISKWAKMESADPGYWCYKGYAVVNMENRGNGFCDGDTNYWGTQDGLDGYDVCEWVAAQSWCTGKVGAFGNSGVAMESLFIAAAQPPHLACVAPWEASADLYRGFLSPGGILEEGMTGTLSRMNYGCRDQYTEDLLLTYEKNPLLNEYWEDKHANLEDIEVPVYVCAGWCHFHLRGSIETFKKVGTPKKWLRVHRDFEWPDDCVPENMDDLTRFFDRYLKNIHNGWEMTPRVRLEVLDAGDCNYQHNRPEKEWPLARTQYTKMYLDAATNTFSLTPVEEEGTVSYESTQGSVAFTYQFTEETELTGHMKLHLWVESDAARDMDIFAFVQKTDENGEFVPVTVIGEPHPGSTGMLRVSLRELDPELSTDYQPVHKFKKNDWIEPGQIVPIDMEILPQSRIYHAGECLRVVIAGHYERKEGWFEPIHYVAKNEGNHIIHCGGQYDSYFQAPIVPARVQAGGYAHR